MVNSAFSVRDPARREGAGWRPRHRIAPGMPPGALEHAIGNLGGGQQELLELVIDLSTEVCAPAISSDVQYSPT